MRVQVFPEQERDEVRFQDLEDDTELGQLKQLQHLIGGYVEPVHTARMDMKQNVLLVDEDGRVKNRKPNFRATSQLGYPTLLLGTVVLVGEYYDATTYKWGDVHE